MCRITTLDTLPLPVSSVKHDIVIVGGGFSGVCLAYHLLRLVQREDLGRRLSCVLVELKPEIGSGLAYMSNGDRHLLNVPGSKMSISDAQVESFSAWLAKHAPHYPGTSFVPRYYYRQYLQDSLNEAISSAAPHVDFYVLHDEVISVCKNLPSDYELCLQSQQKLHASTVVLALGNLLDSAIVQQTQGGKNGREDGRYHTGLRNPWNLDHYSSLSQAKTIAILGAGLSAVDAILQAETAEFCGKYTVISRHGLLPRPHPSQNIEVPDSLKHWAIDLCHSPRPLRMLLREFRSQLNQGLDWHQVIEALRPHLQRLWVKLEQREKQSFLRHLRSIWDVHRHRSPATSIALLEDLKKSKRLTICRGTINEVREAGEGGIEVIVRERGKTKRTSFFYDAAFSCMGPCSNIAKGNSPLVHQLITSGLAIPDALLLGISTTTDGELYARANQVQRNLFTIGPLRRGELWETTAVREIRGQASSLAEAIFQRLHAGQQKNNPVQIPAA